jgi:hypothetical protein
MVMSEMTSEIEYGSIDDLKWDMVFRPAYQLSPTSVDDETYLERPRTIPIGKLILHNAVINDISFVSDAKPTPYS